MNAKKFNWILYLIITTTILTIVVQFYWNYKNYKQNKQQFANQVQISLDNALENYYANLAEANHMTFIDMDSDSLNQNTNFKHVNSDSMFISIENDLKSELNEDIKISGYTQILDSSGFTYSKSSDKIKQVKIIRGKKATDSIKLIEGIASIYISIHDDSLNFTKLNPLIESELKRKHFEIPFALTHYRNDSIINTYNTTIVEKGYLKTNSKTKFLKPNEKIIMAYPNAKKIILKEGLLGILLSIILSLAIISSLFYLLNIIKNQKQLAEVKNDLISNITHEFKTPIATISVALESIKNFNSKQDKEKTSNYLNISTNQLSKLNTMVEKLLETATIDSDSLHLAKEKYNINDLLQSIINKHQFHQKKKTIHFNSNIQEIITSIDVFHFENAINNVIDNAIKYGGDKITIQVEQDSQTVIIYISDNGNTLTNANKEKIFEKFYRIPKGNIHTIKGFGIGLYYTKKIIDKHDGNIQLDIENNKTTFKISLPNA